MYNNQFHTNNFNFNEKIYKPDTASPVHNDIAMLTSGTG